MCHASSCWIRRRGICGLSQEAAGAALPSARFATRHAFLFAVHGTPEVSGYAFQLSPEFRQSLICFASLDLIDDRQRVMRTLLSQLDRLLEVGNTLIEERRR